MVNVLLYIVLVDVANIHMVLHICTCHTHALCRQHDCVELSQSIVGMQVHVGSSKVIANDIPVQPVGTV